MSMVVVPWLTTISSAAANVALPSQYSGTRLWLFWHEVKRTL